MHRGFSDISISVESLAVIQFNSVPVQTYWRLFKVLGIKSQQRKAVDQPHAVERAWRLAVSNEGYYKMGEGGKISR